MKISLISILNILKIKVNYYFNYYLYKLLVKLDSLNIFKLLALLKYIDKRLRFKIFKSINSKLAKEVLNLIDFYI